MSSLQIGLVVVCSALGRYARGQVHQPGLSGADACQGLTGDLAVARSPWPGCRQDVASDNGSLYPQAYAQGRG